MSAEALAVRSSASFPPSNDAGQVTLFGPDNRPVKVVVSPDRVPGMSAPVNPCLTGSGDPPRQFVPNLGWNLIFQPRAEGPNLTGFQTLDLIANNCNLVRIAIEMVKAIITGFEIDVIADDKKTSQSKTSEIKAARAALECPDGIHELDSWLRMLLEELLKWDAANVYRWRTVSGDPYALVILRGDTIKPVISPLGRILDPPAWGYQQIVYGRPETHFRRPFGTSNPLAPDGSEKQELCYRPMNPVAGSPYGMSPVERIILTANIIMRRDTHALTYYTDGTIPRAFWSVGSGWSPDNIREFQRAFNDLLAGNDAERSRVLFMPGGDKGLQEPKSDDEWQVRYNDLLSRLVCAAFGISYQAFVTMMNRATAQSADISATDTSIRPVSQFLERFLTWQLREFWGWDGLRVVFTEEKSLEQQQTVEKNIAYLKAGIYNIDKVLEEEGEPGLGLPNFMVTATGPVFLEKAWEEAQKPPPDPVVHPQPGAPEAGGSPTPPGSKPPAASAPANGKKPAPTKEPPASRAAREDLRRWERIAKKSPERATAFRSIAIDTEVRIALAEWLSHDLEPEGTRWAFRSARTGRRGAEAIRRRLKAEREIRSIVADHYRARKADVARVASDLVRRKVVPTDHVRANDPILSALDEATLAHRLVGPMRDAYSESGKAAARVIAAAKRDEGDDQTDYTLINQAAATYAEERAAELVGMRRQPDGTLIDNPDARWAVTETDRERLRALIAQGIADGTPMAQIESQIEDMGFWFWRAQMIARTEASFAVNSATLDTYSDASIEMVTVLDGEGCLEDGHDDSQIGVDGEVWTVEKAEEYPVGHPNCRRDFAPVFEGEA